MKVELIDDPVAGVVRRFRDSWRSRPAVCLLVGTGSGPQGESVRLVGNPVRGGGFCVSYVRSYDPGQGNARRAYEYLLRAYQGEVRAKEVVSGEGIGFHRAMKDRGIVSIFEIDLLAPPPSLPPR